MLNFIDEEVKPIADRFPVELNNLPSEGKGYPLDLKLSITQYTFEDLLSISQFRSDVNKLLDICTRGIYVESPTNLSFSVDDLFVEDICYLFVLRNLVIKQDYTTSFRVRCPICNQEEIHTIHLRDLAFQELTVEKLPITVEVNGGLSYRLTPITYKIYRFLNSEYENIDLPYKDIVYFILSAMDLPYEDIRPKFLQVIEQIKSITDRELINTLITVSEMLKFGIIDQTLKCQNKGGEENAETFTLNLFRTDYYEVVSNTGAEKSNRINVRFG